MNQGDFQILSYLLRSPEGVDVAMLRYELGAEPRHVEACVERLRKVRCQIEQASPTRLKLIRTSLEVWQDYLKLEMERAGSARRVLVYRRTASTQDVLRSAGDPRVVAIADQQTAGRGRHGRAWSAPPGAAVLMSLGHPLDSDGERLDYIQCVTAVAVAEVLEQLSGRKMIQIKWPNDLIVENRKLAGILVETFAEKGQRFAVIGVGVNVELDEADLAALPAELRGRVTHLRAIGCPYDRLAIATDLIARIDHHLGSPDPQLLLDEWRVRSLMRSQRATFRSNGKVIAGEVVDLDAQAGLIVRTDSGALVHLKSATTVIL